MAKNKKHIKKISVKTTEYYKEDFDAIYNFALSFKECKITKKPSVKYKTLKFFLDNAYEESCKFIYMFENQPKVPISLGIRSNALFYRYWSARKAYNNTGYFNSYKNKILKLENVLDKIIYYSAIIESHKLFQIRNKLKNPKSFNIDSFLQKPDSYSLYFNCGISSVCNINDYCYSLDLIDEAIFKKYNTNSRTGKNKRAFYIHSGKTNSGKTHNAIEMLKNAKKGAYLSPLRLLALEVSDRLNSEGIPCSFVTGEEEIYVENANHIASTVELADFSTEYDVAVIDECQMIADSSRGHCWTKAITNINAREICLCTAPEAVDILKKLIDRCGDYYEVINHRRKTPLVVEDEAFSLDNVLPGDALVAFSKDKVNAIGATLIKKGISVSVLYGALPYIARKQQFENFISGKSTVLVTTDAIGMGVNLPVRRIVFMEVYKYDGKTSRLLNSSEIKQIAGRAGRRGKFDIGYVNANGENELKYIRKKLSEKTEKIKGVCIAFPKSVLQDKNVNIKTVLKSWEMYRLENPYIKENISDALELLKPITRIYDELELSKNNLDIFDMSSMPVDVRNPRVKRLYLDYVEERLSGYTKIKKPYCRKYDTDSLITYTKMLDTYFMCSKSWSLKLDNKWLMEQRNLCNETLLTGLTKNLENHTKYCKNCGCILEWNNKGMYCNNCSL
ncbi:MAG: helicase-related protein [Lachnospirales bacterium]